MGEKKSYEICPAYQHITVLLFIGELPVIGKRSNGIFVGILGLIFPSRCATRADDQVQQQRVNNKHTWALDQHD